MNPTVTLEMLRDERWRPTRATEWSAGYDVRASLTPFASYTAYGPTINGNTLEADRSGSLILYPNDRVVVPLGFKMRMAPGLEAQLRPRSGLALKLGLTLANSPGTIDADFPDEWAAILVNHGHLPVTITDGERIAQVVFHTFATPDVAWGTVGTSTNRVGGYGSTGVA